MGLERGFRPPLRDLKDWKSSEALVMQVIGIEIRVGLGGDLGGSDIEEGEGLFMEERGAIFRGG